ncbi:MAG: hypothetical protein B7Y77_00960 [Bradyrhizobium sp. 35-63-5]|nr:MAG: hypothetical protein B7Y77_00960 [Bradyrhizobium sp. 35-63-5]
MSELFIILTSEQAEAVGGPTGPGAALVPVPLANGLTYVLPAAVLDDPAHEVRHAALAVLPMRPVAADEWPVPADPEPLS